MIVFLNDRFVESEEARISPFDRGFLTGEGLFETMRVYSGHPFALDRHIERLAEGCRMIEIDASPSTVEMTEIVRGLVERNHLDDARLRITLTKGEEGAEKPTLFVSAAPYDGYPKRLYREGMKVKSLSGFRCSSMPVFAVKSTSYLISRMALSNAKRAGFDEAILLNEKAEAVEGATSNIFAVFGDRAVTPPLEAGALPGVTRAILLEFGSREGVSIVERSLALNELREADEVFLTNALMEVMPVAVIDGSPVGNGVHGSVTLKLAEMYRALVEREIGS